VKSDCFLAESFKELPIFDPRSMHFKEIGYYAIHNKRTILLTKTNDHEKIATP
jgi:hypothetical protein